jgi:RNA polymerase sigma-70 factor (ECF subfamily)
MPDRLQLDTTPLQPAPRLRNADDCGVVQSPVSRMAPADTRPEFDRVYADNFPFVWRTLRALGVSGTALDDAAQDVFLVVHRRLHEFDGRASLRTWIFAITERVAFNFRRGARRKQAPLTGLDESQSCEAPGPFERAQDREVSEFLNEFLQSLRDEQRIVFVLSLVEQMPALEIAAALDIPLNTAYTRIRTVKLAFRKAAAARQESTP